MALSCKIAHSQKILDPNELFLKKKKKELGRELSQLSHICFLSRVPNDSKSKFKHFKVS